jgi:cytochrome P450
VNGKEVSSLIPTVDEAKHGQMRRGVANAFTPSTIGEMEHLIHHTTLTLMECLKERKVVDLPQQFLWYSLDTAGQIAFSEDIGFMRSDADVDGGAQIIRGMQFHLADDVTLRLIKYRPFLPLGHVVLPTRPRKAHLP